MFEVLESVITEFVKAGAARNVEAAYACCSPQSPAKEEIAKLIESRHDVFAGCEHLTISGWGGSSGAGIINEAYVVGAITCTGGEEFPFEAHLVKEDDVWKITSIQINKAATAAKWWRNKKNLAIIGSLVVIGILVGTVAVPKLMQFFSGVEPVIAEFMEAGVARNVETAYACWSPQSATEEEIAGYIESSYDDVFAGYDHLNINSRRGESSGGIDSCYVSGAVIYTGDQSLSLKASLVKDNDVWKITGIRIGSNEAGTVKRV